MKPKKFWPIYKLINLLLLIKLNQISAETQFYCKTKIYCLIIWKLWNLGRNTYIYDLFLILKDKYLFIHDLYFNALINIDNFDVQVILNLLPVLYQMIYSL